MRVHDYYHVATAIFVTGIILTIGAMFLVSGCAVTDRAQDRAGDRAADLVDEYCERTSPEDREAVRGRMDERTNPHQVRVECESDE